MNTHLPPEPPDLLAPGPQASPLRQTTYEVIFGHHTRRGRNFDLILIGTILASVVAVVLESVASIAASYGGPLRAIEWGFTFVFTIEYAVRLWCVGRPLRYARSFFGLVDLLAVLPTWISLLLPGGQVLTVVRILRVLRVFRILKLAQYMGEAQVLTQALRASRFKITVFLFSVLNIVVIVGSLMYLVEGPAHGFDSIPRGIYWGIVTLTTVGYGDIAPQTGVGQAIAAVLMVMGYGIIAVPTGIVTVELGRAAGAAGVTARIRTGRCEECGSDDHAEDALYCRRCGSPLSSPV